MYRGSFLVAFCGFLATILGAMLLFGFESQFFQNFLAQFPDAAGYRWAFLGLGVGAFVCSIAQNYSPKPVWVGTLAFGAALVVVLTLSIGLRSPGVWLGAIGVLLVGYGAYERFAAN